MRKAHDVGASIHFRNVNEMRKLNYKKWRENYIQKHWGRAEWINLNLHETVITCEDGNEFLYTLEGRPKVYSLTKNEAFFLKVKMRGSLK
jgi:hypothetical protein